jgi:hypothetical protein
MDEQARLIEAYQSQASASVPLKLDLLMGLERIRDDRVVPFLLEIVQDRHEPDAVRIYVLKRLRSGDGVLGPTDRPGVAQTIGKVMLSTSSAELRLQAALALGEFTEIQGVLTTLSAICGAQQESIDLRYAAFTSLERAGPTPRCIALLRQLTSDETLGRSAQSVLSAWHVEESGSPDKEV